MSRSNWSHLIWIGRTKSGRDEYTTYGGFASKEEVDEFDRFQRDNNYVYFPQITKVWEEDSQWFCILRTADSCD